MKKYRWYLHFTADLNRAVECYKKENYSCFKIFLLHANKIYKNRLLPSISLQLFPLKLQEHWKLILDDLSKNNKSNLHLVADKVLTIETIIFNRFKYYAFH